MQINFSFTIDDKLIERVKKLFSNKVIIAMVLLAVVSASGLIYAAITKPHTFAAGELISASKFNENFDTLYSKVNELESSVGYDSTYSSYYYSNVNGTKTKIYVKYLTGTISSSASVNVPHSISDYNQILSVNVLVYNTVFPGYVVNAPFYGALADRTMVVVIVGSNIQLTSFNDANYLGQKYRIKIEHYFINIVLI